MDSILLAACKILEDGRYLTPTGRPVPGHSPSRESDPEKFGTISEFLSAVAKPTTPDELNAIDAILDLYDGSEIMERGYTYELDGTVYNLTADAKDPDINVEDLPCVDLRKRLDDLAANLDADASGLGIDPNLLRLGAKASAGVVTGKEIGTAIADFGIDNHAQAELVERLFAKEIARRVDGEVLEDTSSVFAPDGGVDAVIRTADGDLTVQVKNLADAVGDATLKEYEGVVNYFASTNGFAEGAEPAARGMKGITGDDWSGASNVELRGNHFLHGIRRIFTGIRDALRSLAGHTKAILSNISNHIASKATAAASWFLALSAGQQLAALAAVLAVAVAVYYLYKRYRNRDHDHSPTGMGTPSV